MNSKKSKYGIRRLMSLVGAVSGTTFGYMGNMCFSIYNKSKIPVYELKPKIVEILDNNTPLTHNKLVDIADYSRPFYDYSRNDNSIYRILADGNLTSEEATKMSNSIVDVVGEYLKADAYNSTELLSELKNTFMGFAHNHQDAILQYAQNVPYDNVWAWVLGGAITGGLILNLVARKKQWDGQNANV